MYKYALTVKYVKLDQTVGDLEQAICHLQHKHSFEVIWTTHELDSKGVIHVHSLIMTSRKIYVPRMNLKGYTVCIRPIIYEKGWYEYAHKETRELESRSSI